MSWLSNKYKNGACSDENNMDSEVEVTFCSKNKGKKRVLDEVLLRSIISQLANHK